MPGDTDRIFTTKFLYYKQILNSPTRSAKLCILFHTSKILQIMLCRRISLSTGQLNLHQNRRPEIASRIPIQNSSILRFSNENGKKLQKPRYRKLPTRRWLTHLGVRLAEAYFRISFLQLDSYERVLCRAYRRYRTDCSVPF